MNDPSAKIAIIVPCFNMGQYLTEALDSVIMQTYSDWICIVVDDGSTDNSAEIAKDYCRKDTRIQYHRQNNMGLSVARNNGINACKSEYILPLDSDDKLAPTYLEQTINEFLKNQSLKVVYTNCQLFGSVNHILMLPDYSFRSLLQRNLITATAIYHRNDFEKTSGYDETIKGWEDWDFWLSLLDKGSQVKKIEDVLFFYRQKEGSMGSNISVDPELKSSLRNYIYHKHIVKYLEFPNDVDILAFRINALEKDYQDSIVNNDRLHCKKVS